MQSRLNISTQISRDHIDEISDSLSTQEDVDEVYDYPFTETKLNKAHFNIIVGDFNVKIARDDEYCMGFFWYGVRNDREEDLVNFARAHGYKITNPFFKNKNHRRCTRRIPNSETFDEIIYVPTDKYSIVKNVKVLNQDNTRSGDRIILCNIKIGTKQKYNNYSTQDIIEQGKRF